MSKSDKSRRPRYTGYGRPVYHEHGSRRGLIEQQSSRSAIREYEDEPLADWERELLEGCEPLPDTRPIRNPFNIGMGFIPGSERRPTQAEQDRLREQANAKRDAWIESTRKRLDQEDRIVTSLRPTDPAKRVTAAHRIRVTDVALMIGLTNVQTIYLLNTVCKEFVPHANATVASIVATDLYQLVTDHEGGRTLVAKILSENGMGEIA